MNPRERSDRTTAPGPVFVRRHSSNPEGAAPPGRPTATTTRESPAGTATDADTSPGSSSSVRRSHCSRTPISVPSPATARQATK